MDCWHGSGGTPGPRPGAAPGGVSAGCSDPGGTPAQPRQCQPGGGRLGIRYGAWGMQTLQPIGLCLCRRCISWPARSDPGAGGLGGMLYFSPEQPAQAPGLHVDPGFAWSWCLGVSLQAFKARQRVNNKENCCRRKFTEAPQDRAWCSGHQAPLTQVSGKEPCKPPNIRITFWC